MFIFLFPVFYVSCQIPFPIIQQQQILLVAQIMQYFFLCFLPILTYQWWDVGHMLTSAIAEIRLNKLHPHASVGFRELTTSINHLCNQKSQTFIESACWPDDLKASQYSMTLWNIWHYVDKVYVPEGEFPVINFTQVAINAINMVNQAVKVISTNMHKNTAERALFARYLTHVVGDMHQPLHSVALFNASCPKGDGGGNFFKVKMPNGTLQNFHSFWDAGGFRLQNDSWLLPRPLNLQNYTLLKSMAQQFIDEFEDQIEQLSKQLNPAKWAIESYKLALNTVYPYIETTNEVSEEYIKLAYDTSRKRITLAGFRLANLAISMYQKIDHNHDNCHEQIWKAVEEQQKQMKMKISVE